MMNFLPLPRSGSRQTHALGAGILSQEDVVKSCMNTDSRNKLLQLLTIKRSTVVAACFDRNCIAIYFDEHEDAGSVYLDRFLTGNDKGNTRVERA